MEPLAIIAAVCLLVWTGVLLLRGGPLAGCLLFLAAATCFSSDFFYFNAGDVKLTIDRVLWAVVMLLAFVWRQRGWSDPKPPGTRAAGRRRINSRWPWSATSPCGRS